MYGYKHVLLSCRYFIALKQVLDENGIMNDPTRITNCDEKGLCLDFRPPKSIQRKGAKHCYQVTAGNKAQITILACGNAAGQMAPPGVIFQGKKVNQKLLKSAPEDNWGIFFSESGWMTGAVFSDWFEKVYLPYVENIRSPGQKVLLLLDGHKSHETLHLLEMAEKNDVVIFCLPPNLTHLLQPLDVAYFKGLQAKWDTVVHRMATSASTKTTKVGRENFCTTFGEVRKLAIAGDERSSSQSSQEQPHLCRSLRNGFR